MKSKFPQKSAKSAASAHHRPVVVAVSGFFNPLHVGHLDMIKKAKQLGDKLVVIINNDKQVALKGRVPFMPEADRVAIIKALRDVDEVFLSIDNYKFANGEVPIIKSLAKVHPDIFANGGDRKNITNVPEYPICQKLGIKMVDGLGRKIRASSEMIARAVTLKAQIKPVVTVNIPHPNSAKKISKRIGRRVTRPIKSSKIKK